MAGDNPEDLQFLFRVVWRLNIEHPEHITPHAGGKLPLDTALGEVQQFPGGQRHLSFPGAASASPRAGSDSSTVLGKGLPRRRQSPPGSGVASAPIK